MTAAAPPFRYYGDELHQAGEILRYRNRRRISPIQRGTFGSPLAFQARMAWNQRRGNICKRDWFQGEACLGLRRPVEPRRLPAS